MDTDTLVDERFAPSKLIKTPKSSNIAEVVSIDLGNLMAVDPRPIDLLSTKKGANLDVYLKELAQQCTQQLVKQLFGLPNERVDDVVIVKLPKCTTIIPREKPVPKPKPLTKWEQFAKMKGINKVKKSRMVYDENVKEFRPRYGYKRKDDVTKDWLIEINQNEKDPEQDFFAKTTAAKNERTAKNELHRLRNIARASGVKKLTGAIPSTGDLSDKFQIKKALKVAKTADASMSKFSQKVKGEDKTTKGLGKKRKFDANNGNMKSEIDRQLKIFDKVTSTKERTVKEKLKVGKAANKLISEEDRNGGGEARNNKKGKRRSEAGKHKRVGGGKPGAGGKFGKKQGGGGGGKSAKKTFGGGGGGGGKKGGGGGGGKRR